DYLSRRDDRRGERGGGGGRRDERRAALQHGGRQPGPSGGGRGRRAPPRRGGRPERGDPPNPGGGGARGTGELQRVSEIVCRIGKLARIEPGQDVYAAGLSSVSALELLLELETAFGVSIPDDLFVASRTPRALARVVAALREQAEFWFPG